MNNVYKLLCLGTVESLKFSVIGRGDYGCEDDWSPLKVNRAKWGLMSELEKHQLWKKMGLLHEAPGRSSVRRELQFDQSEENSSKLCLSMMEAGIPGLGNNGINYCLTYFLWTSSIVFFRSHGYSVFGRGYFEG